MNKRLSLQKHVCHIEVLPFLTPETFCISGNRIRASARLDDAVIPIKTYSRSISSIRIAEYDTCGDRKRRLFIRIDG